GRGEPRHRGPAGEAQVGGGEAGRAPTRVVGVSGVHHRTLTDEGGLRSPTRGDRSPPGARSPGSVAETDRSGREAAQAGRRGDRRRGLAYTGSAYRRANGDAR